MTRVRFNTDRALFETFPSARDDVKSEPMGIPPLVFLQTLMGSAKFDDALSFCAYLLPRREAVAWGCRSLRRRLGDRADVLAPPALKAAEDWVEDPGETTRLAAYRQWTEADREDPPTWLALAATWSGGSLVPDAVNSIAAPPHLTATALRVALLLSLHRLKLPEKRVCAESWIADGMRIAELGL